MKRKRNKEKEEHVEIDFPWLGRSQLKFSPKPAVQYRMKN
jgi:hypothetical protein